MLNRLYRAGQYLRQLPQQRDQCDQQIVANSLVAVLFLTSSSYHKSQNMLSHCCCHVVVAHCRCHIVVVMLSLSHCCCHIVDVTLSLLRCRCHVLRCSELLSSWQIDKTRSRWNEVMKIRRWRHIRQRDNTYLRDREERSRWTDRKIKLFMWKSYVA